MDTENEEGIQTQEQVSPKELVSTTTLVPKKVEIKVEPQPLTEERIAQMIAEATAKAVKEAKESGKRELQSQQDRNKAELTKVERRARIAEQRTEAVRTHLRTADPEVAKEIELAELRAEKEGRLTVEQEEELAQQQGEFVEKFHTSISQIIANLGVDPKDERIDWAADAKDAFEAQQRILTSAARIQQEKVQATQNSLEKRLGEIEAKIKAEEKEANSVETSTSVGVVAGSDREFVKQFADGTVPITPENVKRYNKIIES